MDIQISNTLTNTVLGHHSDSFLSDGSKSTFKIMFKEPIEILPDLLYTASATLRVRFKWLKTWLSTVNYVGGRK